MSDLISQLARVKVVPVITIHDLEDALPMSEALLEGGINVVEITLRTDCALDASKAIKANLPEMIVGVGTIITTDQIDQCVDFGADFVVTPGTSQKLASHLVKTGIPAIPGISTAGEAVTLLEYGFDFQKFFPAEANGGIPTLKAIGGPLPQIKFMPTGGIQKDMVRSYLDLPSVIATGGSWIVDKKSLANKDWAQITRNAKMAIEL